ncbi:MAG TPA: hypothetical protein DCY32_01350 [Opitutae bacterium]|nr:hypothetical protein [Opitutae bacterium]
MVTATLALDGKGGVVEYAGGCADWLDQMSRPRAKAKTITEQKPKPVREAPKKRKLLNKEREALATLPGKIEEMEAERDRITALMQETDYYRNSQNDPVGDQQKLERLENEILQSYERWEELDNLVKD